MELTITAPPPGYPYRIGVVDLAAELALLCPQPPVVISDARVAELWRARLGIESPWLLIPPGEASKNLGQAERLYGELAGLGVDRQTTIVAVGGGVVGDLAGFVAATYLRGLPLIQVPTTLLAMVDSSLGGKVGVDLPQGKNLVGAFHPPRAVLAHPEFLETLSEADWSQGIAETIKHALLDSEDMVAWLESLPRSGAALSGAQRAELVQRSAGVKVQVVGRDPYERGERAHLNLGHTLGHALETAGGYARLSHGQAISIGLVASLRLSQQVGWLEQPGLPSRVEHFLQSWRLPVRVPPELDWSAVARALTTDKKRVRGALRFILPIRAGAVRIHPDLELGLVESTFRELQEAP